MVMRLSSAQACGMRPVQLAHGQGGAYAAEVRANGFSVADVELLAGEDGEELDGVRGVREGHIQAAHWGDDTATRGLDRGSAWC